MNMKSEKNKLDADINKYKVCAFPFLKCSFYSGQHHKIFNCNKYCSSKQTFQTLKLSKTKFTRRPGYNNVGITTFATWFQSRKTSLN